LLRKLRIDSIHISVGSPRASYNCPTVVSKPFLAYGLAYNSVSTSFRLLPRQGR
jgi:hypothetical protein